MPSGLWIGQPRRLLARAGPLTATGARLRQGNRRMAEHSDAFATAATPHLTLLGRIVSLCDRFESEWRAGREPAIEPFVEGLPPSERDSALKELITVEVELRRARGEAPSMAAYWERFPDDKDVVTRAFRVSVEEANDPYRTVVGSQATVVSAPPTWPPPAPADAPVVGHYRIVRSHARGGLGEVFVAVDEILKREVALKQIQPRRASDPSSRARFLTEAEVTGGLEHPGIVPVYGLGRDEHDRPYYAMRLIRGDTFESAIRQLHEGQKGKAEQRLEFRQLLLRFLSVCNAIAYANSRGVLHRDLKPGNVMLGPFGETLVVDWGLAKVMNRPDAAGEPPPGDPDATELDWSRQAGPDTATQAGTVLGTPHFMSPEQATGLLEEMGPWSDVYSLGAILYNLLVGHPPIEADDLQTILRRARDGDFPPPRQLNSLIPPTLEAICLKALHRDRTRRYQSARELADDLELWLADAPVSAIKDPPWTAMARWARRHKPLVASLAAIVITAITVTLFVVRAMERQQLTFKADSQRKIDLANADRERQAILAENAEKIVRAQEYSARLAAIRESRINPQPGWTWTNIEALAGLSRLNADIRDERALRSEAVASLTGSDLRQVSEYTQKFTAGAVAYRADGKFLAVGQFKAQAFIACSIRLVDLATGKVAEELKVAPKLVKLKGKTVQDGVRALAFSHDGRWLVAGLRSGRLIRWDLLHPDRPSTSWDTHQAEIERVLFAGDDEGLLTLDVDGHLIRWAIREGWKATASATARDVSAATQPLDGKLPIYAVLGDRRPSRIDPTTLKTIETFPVEGVDTIAVSPEARFLVVAKGSELELVSVAGKGTIRRLFDPVIDQAHSGPISRIYYTENGARILSVCDQNNRREIKLWEVANGRLIAMLDPGGVTTLQVAVRPDGRGFVATGQDNVRGYEFSHDDILHTVAFEHEALKAVEFDTDGHVLAALSRGELGIWNPQSGANLLRKPTNIGTDSDGLVDIAQDPTSPLLAYHGTGDDVHVWSPVDGKPALVLKVREPGLLVFDRKGKLWGLSENRVFSWSRGETEAHFHWQNKAAEYFTGLAGLIALAVSENDVFVAARDGVIHQLRGSDGTYVRALGAAGDPVRSLAVNPEGSVVVAGTQNGEILMVNMPDGKLTRIPKAHAAPVLSLVFGPMGKLLVSGCYEGSLRFWMRDGDNFKEIMVLRASPRPVDMLSWSGDGSRLAVLIRGENAIRVLDLRKLCDRLHEVGIEADCLRP